MQATFTMPVNRLTQLNDGASLAVTYSYDLTNKLTARNLPNGVATTYEYDGIDRLTRLRDARAATTIADKQYQYNTASQITQLTDLVGVHAYGYDAVDRLTSAAYPNTPTESYSYDAVGNRTSSHLSASYTHQPFNRLTSTATATYTYDNNGNLLTKSDGAGTTQYQWDFENRLTQVTLPNSDMVDYKYDALGRRIERSAITYPSVTSTTRFVYDSADVIRDTDANGVTTADYLNGPGVDNKIRQIANGTSFYFLTDQLGSTSALTDTQGNVVEQISYDSFGNSTGSALTRYTYTGREQDSLTGQFYYRARFYDPQIGRFVSEDPIGLAQEANLYAYVMNNPIRHIDPNGTNPLLPLAAVALGEALLHNYLGGRADRFYPGDDFGRKKHCYVNCMSTRIHGFNPVWPNIANASQEAGGLAVGFSRGAFRNTVKDSAGDMGANIFGQASAGIIWRWCKDLCAECPF